MDFNNLKDQVSNLSLYDVKAGIRKVQNAVMNYTEMEAKVREATNNEPWGASSTLMQEIASATFNYQLLNEIMPILYKRFTEKTAEEWRQIYKALQLLEFLIKNGSERVIDDARSHLSLMKMLRQFHFIDNNGKDQGINVRNRAKELAELLSDVERIRTERKKARANRNKYGGVEGGLGGGIGGLSGSSRYGGFGSETGGAYGAYSGGVYGDGGGFGGNESGFSDTQARGDRFEEYDEYDEGAVAATPKRNNGTSSTAPPPKAENKKPKQPEVDLFSFDDPAPSGPSTSTGKQPVSGGHSALANTADDDEFDDFQSAAPTQPAATTSTGLGSVPPPASVSTTTSATQFAAPQPVQGTQSANINTLFASVSSPPLATPSMTASQPSLMSQPPKPTGFQPSGPNYFTSVQIAQQAGTGASTPAANGSGVLSPSGSIGAKPGAKPASAASSDPFADLLAGTNFTKPTSTSKPMTMADMAKQKSSAGIWGAPQSSSAGSSTPGTQSTGQKPGGGSSFDDLLS
ncbi:ENTH-domain-containing protein [Eremomyces bilateralis CBS 781.70]|uniref:ENTH-domain-containing protein n=1 Tax=Eremomyces bilateralis CBS 781.70 TaxID=1392243 RepID=A0A6G1FUP6_9PEZI|nr:ENTH-domain-containing protein [Eremomyces bilateralis CBS 781.70]KAF1809389.1 ENTH-domain-containing protein [Eremomyces bilateralis CBS 781.70]